MHYTLVNICHFVQIKTNFFHELVNFYVIFSFVTQKSEQIIQPTHGQSPLSPYICISNNNDLRSAGYTDSTSQVYVHNGNQQYSLNFAIKIDGDMEISAVLCPINLSIYTNIGTLPTQKYIQIKFALLGNLEVQYQLWHVATAD